MPSFLASMPFYAVFTILAVGVWLRGHLVYSVFRAAIEFSLKRTQPKNRFLAKIHRKLSDGSADLGIRLIQRWGLVAVPLCYLTVGVQTAVLGGAGVLRINRLKFGLAQIPGCLAWSAIYSTIGFTVWAVIFKKAAASPLGVAAIVIFILAILVSYLIMNQRRRRRCPLRTEITSEVNA